MVCRGSGLISEGERRKKEKKDVGLKLVFLSEINTPLASDSCISQPSVGQN